jgi:death on curing protein
VTELDEDWPDARPGDPSFLSPDEVLALHAIQLRLFGGQDGIRDEGLLLSAVAMPLASFGGEWLHASLFHMAAAYAFHIAENQPFIDGNKRTALHAALEFLKRNGVTIEDPDERLRDAMLQLADKRLDKDGLAELFTDLAD